MASEFYNGKRLSFDGQLCTVRYYGEVKGTKGDWLGVEWDDPTRGKHSGEHGGIRYFECISKIATAGSFVRPTRKADSPRSFVEALKAKYASEEVEDPNVQVVYVGKSNTYGSIAQQNKPIRFSGKEAEEVGFDKIRKKLANLHELRIVLLDGLCTWRPETRKDVGAPESNSYSWPQALDDVKEVSPKIIELDLSRNLFEEWREIASICEQLEYLKSLRTDGNRFRDTTITGAERDRCLSAFSKIKTLSLENLLLPWQELTAIASLFADITTFVVSSNEYTNLSMHFLPTTITNLILEDNSFSAISDLQPLTKLPNLQRLILKQNNISETVTPGADLPTFSPTLTEVDLSFNSIHTWSFIDGLEHVFPGLTSLRVSHNPLYSALHAPDGKPLTAEDGYMLTLARLGNLRTLNYGPITPKERLNSESYYLSQITLSLSLSPTSTHPSILSTHPRYPYLCAEYGEPVINPTTSTLNPNALAARFINFTFYLSQSAKSKVEEGKQGRFETEIPMSLNVYAVQGIVGRRYGVKPWEVRLVWETGDWMLARREEVAEDETWDSETDEEDGGMDGEGERIMREVEIVAGTRLLGTWVDGREATVRVEMR